MLGPLIPKGFTDMCILLSSVSVLSTVDKQKSALAHRCKFHAKETKYAGSCFLGGSDATGSCSIKGHASVQ